MANGVSIKAFLIKDGDKDEIRRFSLTEDVATSFIYLKEKLRATFPSKLTESFEIYWKDNDGDDITISSDDELTIALTESRKDDIFKVYVMAQESRSTDGPTHNGVFCDECKNPISGFRYKCLGCHNYDLCADCEFKGVHKEHLTVRIPTPLNLQHQFGHRLINKLTKAAKRAESKCPWSQRTGGPHHGGHHGGGHHHGGRHQRPATEFPLFEDLSAEFTNNCTTEEPSKGYCGRRRQRCEQSQGGNQPNIEVVIGKAGEAAAAAMGAASAAVGTFGFDPNTIVNTLNEMGIDVSGFFAPPSTPSQQNQGQQTQGQQNQGQQTQGQQTSGTQSSSFSQTQKNAENTQENVQKTNETENKTKENGESPPKVPKISTSQTSQPSSTPIPTPAQSEGTSVPEGWTIYNPNDEQGNTTELVNLDSPMASPPPAPTAPQETNQVTDDQMASTSNPNSNPIYPSLGGLPKDEKVAAALDQMLAMGFKNDDGWLTNLLNLQDGSIAKVLDLIQPSKK